MEEYFETLFDKLEEFLYGSEIRGVCRHVLCALIKQGNIIPNISESTYNKECSGIHE